MSFHSIFPYLVFFLDTNTKYNTHSILSILLLLLFPSVIFLRPKTRRITQKFQHHTRVCASHSPSKTPISSPASPTHHLLPPSSYKKHLSILLIVHQLKLHILPITFSLSLSIPTSGNRYGSFEYPIEAIDWNDKFR